MFDWCHGFDPVKLLVQHEISALKKKKWTSEWMCFRVRTRRSEQGTWDGLGPSTCYYTKIAGGSTFCIWPVPCWWAGHGAWGTADAPWVAKADYNNAGMVLLWCSPYTEQGSGEKSQAHSFLSRRMQRAVAPINNIFERSLEKAPFPTEWFFFSHSEEASQKPWKLIKPLIEHTGLKLFFKKRCLPKAFYVQMP